MSTKRTASLRFTGLVSFVLLLPCVVLWLVNLDIAIKAIQPEWEWLAAVLPENVYAPAATLAVDYSTVSTLVPALLLLFPFVMSIKINLRQRINPDYVHMVEWDPYPPQFPFFLVMLGLTGTLYGLYIGLDVSGVSELGKATASAETIRSTIDRLLDGTATALLSSLVGLIGAFLASRPLTWIFRRLAFIPSEEDKQPLSDTLSTLNQDLMELSRSSRDFSEHLSAGFVDGIQEYMRETSRSLNLTSQKLDSVSDKMDSIASTEEKILERLAPLSNLSYLENTAELKRLANIEENGKKMNSVFESLESELEQLRNSESDFHAAIENHCKEGAAKLGDVDDHLATLRSSIESINTKADDSKTAFKTALAKYLEGLSPENEQ